MSKTTSLAQHANPALCSSKSTAASPTASGFYQVCLYTSTFHTHAYTDSGMKRRPSRPATRSKRVPPVRIDAHALSELPAEYCYRSHGAQALHSCRKLIIGRIRDLTDEEKENCPRLGR